MSSLPNKLAIALGCFVLLFFTGKCADAGVIPSLPDFFVFIMDGSYDKNSGALELSGVALKFTDLDGNEEDFTVTSSGDLPEFSLSAVVDVDTGGIITSLTGDYSIKKPSMGSVSLLKGTLSGSRSGDFASMGALEFDGSVDEGTYSADYQGNALILLGNLSTSGGARSFLTDVFTFNAGGVADVARPVPEPATLSYLAIALVVGYRRRKQNKHPEA